jgi:hypothetical protein
MRVFLAVFRSSIETIFLHTKVENFLCLKNFTQSALCSSTYIPPSSPLARHALTCPLWYLCDLCFEFIQHIHSLAVHLIFHITPKKGVQKHKIRRMKGPCNWSSSSYSSTWEILIQTAKDKINRCIIQLKNTTVGIELGNSIIFLHY